MLEVVDENDILKAEQILTDRKEIRQQNELYEYQNAIGNHNTKHLDTTCYLGRVRKENLKDHITKVDKEGNPCWYRYKIGKDGKYDKKGDWDRKHYICSACYSANGENRKIRLVKNDFENRLEWRNAQAQKIGFDDEAERKKISNWERGIQRPIDEAKDSSSYFGVCIGEKYVSQTFDNPKMMPYGNPGYDWECKNGLKIQHEARCLCRSEYATDGTNPQFKFTHIDYNKVADVFILSGWKDRKSLEPLHVWAFYKDDIVRGELFWMRDSLSITNIPLCLREFEKFEVTSRLDKLKDMCKDIKNKI